MDLNSKHINVSKEVHNISILEDEHKRSLMEQSHLPFGDSDKFISDVSPLEVRKHSSSRIFIEKQEDKGNLVSQLTEQAKLSCISSNSSIDKNLGHEGEDRIHIFTSQNKEQNTVQDKYQLKIEVQPIQVSNPSESKPNQHFTATEDEGENTKYEQKDAFIHEQDIKIDYLSNSSPQKRSLRNSLYKSAFDPRFGLNQSTGNQEIQQAENQAFKKGIEILLHQIKESSSRQSNIESQVKRFIFYLKNRRSNRKINDLTIEQRDTINDAADNSSICGYTSKKQNLCKEYFFSNNKVIIPMIAQRMRGLRVIEPTDPLKIAWDALQIIFNFLFFYLFSIVLFFAQNEQSIAWLEYFYFLFIVFLALDIMISFNSSFYFQDQVIESRQQIIRHYMSTSCIPDTICLVSSLFSGTHQDESIVYNPGHLKIKYLFSCLIFLRVFGLIKKLSIFQNISALSNSQRHLLRLFNQLLFMISFAHCLGIMWYILGLYQQIAGKDIFWLKKYQIIDVPWMSKYIYSIYWAVTTMITVGYGDITPSNPSEALFTAVSMIMFSCVFAYSINNIGMILGDIEKNSRELNDNIIIMMRYLRQRNVNTQLRSRIRHYLNFLAEETRDRSKEAEDRTLALLSNKLRDELIVEVNNRILKTCSLFEKYFSNQTLQKIVFCMREIQVAPNEVIFQQNEVGDAALYFVQDGCIEIYSELEGHRTVLKELQPNQYFGEFSFFSGLGRKASARSTNLSTLCLLTRDDFLTIIQQHTEDFQRFKMLQEQIVVQNDLALLNVSGCYSCQRQDHYSVQCPATHLVRDKQFVFLRSNYFEFQKRNVKTTQRRNKNCNLNYAKQLVHENLDHSNRLVEEIYQIGGELLERIEVLNIGYDYSESTLQEETPEQEFLEEQATKHKREQFDTLSEEDEDGDDEDEEDQQSSKMSFSKKDFKEKIKKQSDNLNLSMISISSRDNNNNGINNSYFEDSKMYYKIKSNSGNSDINTIYSSRFKSVAGVQPKDNKDEQEVDEEYETKQFYPQSINNQFHTEDSKYDSDCQINLVPSSTGFEKKYVNECLNNKAGLYFQNANQLAKVNEEPKRKSISFNLSEISPLEFVPNSQPSSSSKLFHKIREDQQQADSTLSKLFSQQQPTRTSKKHSSVSKINKKEELIKNLCSSEKKILGQSFQRLQSSKDDRNSPRNTLVKLRTTGKKKQSFHLENKETPKTFGQSTKNYSYAQTISMECLDQMTSGDIVFDIKNQNQESAALSKKLRAFQLLGQCLFNDEGKNDKDALEAILATEIEKNNVNIRRSDRNIPIGLTKINEESSFEKMQIFSKFFPHNNFDLVIQKTKVRKSIQIKIGQKLNSMQQQKFMRRKNVLQEEFIPIHKEIMRFGQVYLLREMSDLSNLEAAFRPTVLSYGINTFHSRIHPLRMKGQII